MTDHSPHQTQPSILPTSCRAAESLTAPDGSAVRLLLTEAHGATRCSMVEVSIPAGAVSRPVRHCTVEEVWYIIAGWGRVWRCPPDLPAAEVAPVGVAAGDAIVIPTGWAFQFAADGNDDGAGDAEAGAGGLRFICVTMPPWPGMDEAEILPPASGGLGLPTLSPP